jgi:hypothetical protein
MHFDAETEHWDSRLTDEAADLFEQLLAALVSARRIDSGVPGRSLLIACKVRTRAEAQALGAIVRELLAGNHDGARSCLAALAEDGFARPYRRVTT